MRPISYEMLLERSSVPELHETDQYAKNQCMIVETLLENLRYTLDKDGTRKDLRFTF